MSNTQIVTISNRIPQEDYYTYQYLQKSAGDNEILVLGQEHGQYTGLSDKPRILYNAIKNGTIKSDYIVFVDAWDVVFVKTLADIMEEYNAHGYDIMIGAEKNCFPSNFKKEYDRLEHSSSYKYLNSGVIVGRTSAIMEALEAMDAPNLPVDYHDSNKGHNFHFNDQAYFMDIFLRQPVSIRLDYRCAIAQNMQDVKEDEIEFEDGGFIKNKETNNCPCIIHWNGGSKTGWSRERILKHLNLI